MSLKYPFVSNNSLAVSRLPALENARKGGAPCLLEGATAFQCSAMALLLVRLWLIVGLI
jgi:hypothetical protein